MAKLKKKYLYIDEGGDSSFFAKRKKLLVGTQGFQPMLNLGMIGIEDKVTLHKAVSDFMQGLKADPLYNSIHSLSQPDWFLHACKDHPEVRAKFFEYLRTLGGFKSYVVVGRKRLSTFKNKHNNNEREFYFDLVYHLLKDRLNDENVSYQIFLSARQRSTQKFLGEAIAKAIERDNDRRKVPKDITYKFDIVRSQDTPILSIVDYLLWALHRLIINKEVRFYNALKDKFNLIIDLYDFNNYGNGNSNYYHRKNQFTLEKASEFRSDGYI